MLGRISDGEVKKRALGIPLRWCCLSGPLLSPKWSVTAIFVYPVRRGQAPTLSSCKSMTCAFYFLVQTMYTYHIHAPLAACMLSHVQLFAAAWTVAHPLSLELSRQECWSGLAGGFFTAEPPGAAITYAYRHICTVHVHVEDRSLSLLIVFYKLCSLLVFRVDSVFL